MVIVLDDGEGVSREKFRLALRSIGKGVKKPGSIGRFGLGLISPLNKCEYFEFSSHPVDAEKANNWTFAAKDILPQHEDMEIPYTQTKRLPRVPTQFVELAASRYAAWRTILRINTITTDKIIGVTDLDELESQVRTKLGIEMRKKKTSVHVVMISVDGEIEERDIDPLEFTGEPLPVAEFTDEICGTVRVQLYRAPRTGGQRKGLVTVMQIGDNTQVPWNEFYTQALGARALEQPNTKTAFDILWSGYFEGVIFAEKVELDVSRGMFKIGDPLRALYKAIARWYEEQGAQYYEDEKEARRDERWHELGRKSLANVLARLLKGDKDSRALARLLVGALPEAARAREVERQREDTDDGSDATKDAPDKPKKRVVADPPESKPRPHDPRERPLSFTLRFAYEVLPHSTRLWEFDAETGVLTFNVRHPTWAKLDETKGKHTSSNDRQIMHLQEWLTLKLLLILARREEPDYDFELARLPVDEESKLYVTWFIAT